MGTGNLNFCRGLGKPISIALPPPSWPPRSEEHTSELQSPCNLVCRLLLEKKKQPPPRRLPGSRSTAAPERLPLPTRERRARPEPPPRPPPQVRLRPSSSRRPQVATDRRQ